MEQYVGTVEQFGGTVWLNSVVEQCGGTVWNSMEQYGGTVEQCGGTAWNSIMEQGDSTVLNIIVEV